MRTFIRWFCLAMLPLSVSGANTGPDLAGVAAISMYETNDMVLRPELDELLDVVRDYDDPEELLNGKAWLREWPIDRFGANCGMDNSSAFSGDVYIAGAGRRWRSLLEEDGDV